MKQILLSLGLLLPFSLQAADLTYDQEKVVYAFLDFINGVKDKDCPDVEVNSYRRNGDFISNDKKVKLKKEEFEKLDHLSSSVLQMIPKKDPNNLKSRFGSAFNIGNNLVLTNVHVLDESYVNLKYCKDFQLRDVRTHQSMSCKKVHYCQVDIDVCLIEMNQMKNVPALKLKAHPGITLQDKDSKIVTAIGNSAGDGIKVSEGKGVIPVGKQFRFFAPLAHGNSGGPLLDDSGSVIGVVRAMQRLDADNLPLKEIPNKPDKFVKDPARWGSLAASTEYVIEAMRKGLAQDPETLKKFNEAILEN
jgi:Trypsin-like peptidase domain